MFKNVSELKKFLIWAKAERISEVKVGEIHVVFSSLALMDTLQTNPTSHISALQAMDQTPKTEEQLKKEEEDLLYHSAL